MEFVTLYRIGDKLGWSVYIHISPSNKYYVGITSKTPEERWRNGFGYYTQSYFYNAIQKYGWNNFQHEIIAENLSGEEAKNFEIKLIKILKSNDRKYGYNITNGGDGVHGLKHTEEWCMKHSKSISGENNPMYGKKHSPETLQKISESRKGKCVGMDNPFYGCHHTKETIDKIQKNRSWYKPSEETISKISKSNKKSVAQICTNDNKLIKVFASAKDASEELNIDKGSITKCCQHKRKTAGGYIWEYYSNYIK